ncbi:MAG: peptide ABC transporter permease [Paracoccus denitrificans]|nr:MAG: peptide ABC transporter permease [Paracoccus denitrificans]PZO86315.1 MAG: peptide ABC transporter permease [Paracoccus denitrificans]
MNWRNLIRFNLILGGVLTVTVIAAAVFAPWLTSYDPMFDADLMSSELPPSAEHWFGTDNQGRDVFSRVVYGARVSLTVGIVSQLINSAIGLTMGLTAGYFGGWWDDFVNGLTNVMLSIPSLVFALAVMAVLGPGIPSLLIALGLTNWAWTCRIARSSVLSLKTQGYVQAAQTLGYGDFRIMFTQLLPNMIGPILVMATLGIGDAVLAEAALSFLGLGIRPPAPSWGNMLTDAREAIRTTPWATIFPGLAVFATVLGFNLLGDGVRDLLDPRSGEGR